MERSIEEVKKECIALSYRLCEELRSSKRLTPMHYFRQYQFIDLLHEWIDLTK